VKREAEGLIYVSVGRVAARDKVTTRKLRTLKRRKCSEEFSLSWNMRNYVQSLRFILQTSPKYELSMRLKSELDINTSTVFESSQYGRSL